LNSDKLVHWEIVFFDVSDDLLIEGFRHDWLSVEDPKISVVGAADD